jgi:hypothetical protein
MRWLALAVFGACSFSPGALAGDAGPQADVRMDGVDAANDASIDGTPPSLARVRSIDLVDALVVGAHTNFPLLVGLVAQPWLRSSANAGDVAREDGFDIHFSLDQQGSMPLAFELEHYAPAVGDMVAWVRVPSLDAQTVIYMHYGDAAITTNQEDGPAVWTNGYAFVLHMNGEGDATGKSSVSVSADVGSADGIGEAGLFDGSTSVYNAGSGTAVDNIWVGGGNAEGWFFANSFGENNRGRLFDKNALQGWVLFLNNDANASNSVSFIHGGTGDGQWYGPTNSVTTGAWHHISCNYDKSSTSNDPSVYLDGVAITMVQDITPSGIDDDGPGDLLVGNNSANTRTFDGVLDEMRLSTVTRSSGWILTQFRNQANPAAFFAVSAPL